MVPKKYSLAAIAQHLLALFEVRRPGVARWDTETQQRFGREADSALLQMEQQCRELGVDDPPHWQRARAVVQDALDRKSTRLNSSHANISYAVFCLKKKKTKTTRARFHTYIEQPYDTYRAHDDVVH